MWICPSSCQRTPGHVTFSHCLSLLFHFPPTAGSLFNTSLSLFHTERACGLLSLSGKSELPEDLLEDALTEYSSRRHFERAEVSTNKSILFSFLLIAHYRSSWHWTAKPGSPQCHLPTQLKNVSVSTIPGALSALEALCDYALYKSTFTLITVRGQWQQARHRPMYVINSVICTSFWCRIDRFCSGSSSCTDVQALVQ